MRDFLNEDELALLKETCTVGQIELAERNDVLPHTPETASFKTGVINSLKECYLYRNLSAFQKTISDVTSEIESLAEQLEGNFEGNEYVAFLHGRLLQAEFIFERLLTFRFVKGTLDSDCFTFSKIHLAFIELWRKRELGTPNLVLFKEIKK